MKVIEPTDTYDQPPYAECDLDALVINVALPNLAINVVQNLCGLLGVPVPAVDLRDICTGFTLPLTSDAGGGG